MVALIYLIHNILETKPYVIVSTVDSSKALVSLRHSPLLLKYASRELQDNIYCWIESYISNAGLIPQPSHEDSSPTKKK